MDLKLVQIFVRVVKYSNFTAASAHESMHRTSIMRNIKELEGQIGFILIERGCPRSDMKLTTSGEVFYQSACRLIRNLKKIAAAQVTIKNE